MKTVKCDLCSYQASKPWLLRNHKLSVHSESRPWQCKFPGCKYKAKLQETLNIHVKLRHSTGEAKNFQCGLCHKSYHLRKHLYSHIRAHLKESYFDCSFCNYKTDVRSKLAKHVRNVHESLKTFMCSFHGCKFETKYKTSLNHHIKRHNPDLQVRRPFPCTQPGCSYRAAVGQKLKQHTLSRHNNSTSQVKAFQCPFCPQRFSHRFKLNSHLKRAHLNEGSYKCDMCNYKAVDKDYLQRHYDQVHDEAVAASGFICESCSFSFRSKNSLHTHLRHKHPEKWETMRSQGSSKSSMEKDKEDSALRNNFGFTKIPVVLLTRLNIKVV